MARWDYRCEQCGYEEEYEGSIHDGPPGRRACPVCMGNMVRVYSVPHFNRSSANAEDTYNPSLGIAHRTDAQAQEHLKRLNDTEGTHLTLADPGDTRMV